MAAAFGVIGRFGDCGSGSAASVRSRKKTCANRKNGGAFTLFCVASSSSPTDPYKTLRIDPGASESQVKKAFRKLALQYHPDVCRESNSSIQFSQITEAYHMAMGNLRGETRSSETEVEEEEHCEETIYNEYHWGEWKGWAGFQDYSSQVNPLV